MYRLPVSLVVTLPCLRELECWRAWRISARGVLGFWGQVSEYFGVPVSEGYPAVRTEQGLPTNSYDVIGPRRLAPGRGVLWVE